MSESIDLPRLITDVIAEVQPGADSRGVLVRTSDLASLPARAFVDAAWLRRTLHHALDLAVYALPSGVVEVALTPTARPDTWHLACSGTRADAADADVRVMATVALRPVADGPAIAPRRVLVVDDSALQRTLIRAFIASTPHSVADVDSGTAALEHLRLHDDYFDVIVVDLQMPGMDGLSTIAAIREHESTTRRPRALIIALTSVGASDDVSDAAEAGADDCLAKPLSEAAFLAMVSAPTPPSPPTPPTPPAPPTPPNAFFRYHLSSALTGPAATRLERLRAVGTALAEHAASRGLTDVAMLAGLLASTCGTGTLRDAEIAARTLQAWLGRMDIDSPA
jgi:CheY-like chemotaxis protein